MVQTARCDAKRILLATDSPTLNADLMNLAIAVSASGGLVKVDTLAYKAMYGVPIEEDFHAISESDQVIFQDRHALYPPFTNQRARNTSDIFGRVGMFLSGSVTMLVFTRCDVGSSLVS